MNNLEPNEAEIRKILQITTDRIVEFLGNIDQPSKFNSQRSNIEAQELGEAIPETQQQLEQLLQQLFDIKIPNALPTAHPGFMADTHYISRCRIQQDYKALVSRHGILGLVILTQNFITRKMMPYRLALRVLS